MTGTTNGWNDLTATVPDDATHIRFRYMTDGAAVESGFRVDNIAIAGNEIGTAETDEGWLLDGFRTTTGSDVSKHTNAYFVDNRQYVGGDKTLGHLYNFAGFEKRPNWVDFFSYSPGALITYWDSSYFDNNVGEHPGHGELLPVDANPEFDHAPDGSLLRPRISSHDAAFGLVPDQAGRRSTTTVRSTRCARHRRPAALRRHEGLVVRPPTSTRRAPRTHPGHYQPAWYSVDVPKTGTTIKVVKVNDEGVMTVQVGTSG